MASGELIVIVLALGMLAAVFAVSAVARHVVLASLRHPLKTTTIHVKTSPSGRRYVEIAEVIKHRLSQIPK